MKNIVSTLISCCFFSILQAQTPSFQWAKGMGGPFNEEPFGICTDISGNVYTAGQFSNTADFDPGTGVVNLTSQGGYDIYISKVDGSGNYIWSKQVGGLYADAVRSMKNDAAGNLYITGTFAGSVDFDPGAGTSMLSTNAGTIINTYVLKLDVNGNFLWVLRVGDGSQNYPQSQAICIDGFGNIFVSGQFTGTRDFDPGVGVSNLVATTLTAFLLKLDPLGNFAWAAKLGGVDAPSIVVDGSGSVYTGGAFSGTGDFDPGPGVSNLISFGGYDGFILKLNTAGNFVWARQFGGTSNDEVISVAVDCYGNIVGAGNFAGTFDVNPGAAVTTFTNLGNYDIFVAKLDPAGNFLWGDQIGGPTIEYLSFMDTDVAGDVYLTGYYQGFGQDFNPGPDTYSVTVAGANALFIVKLGGGGNFVWAYGYGTPNEGSVGKVITIDSSFNIYICGFLGGTIDFNPFAGISTLTSAGSSGLTDSFVLKFSQPGGTPVPVIVTSNSPLCAGLGAQLTASGSGTLTWYSSPTSTTVIGTGTTFVAPTLTTNSTFYVESQVCGFTSTRTPVTVIVNPMPNVTVTASQTLICNGAVYTATAGGAQSYLWNNTSTTSIISVTPSTTNSSYTVSGTSNSCTASASITFSVVLCSGFESLSTHPEEAFVIYPNPGTGAFNILTAEELVLKISNETGQTIKIICVEAGKPSLSLNDLSAGIYFVTVVDSAVKPQKIIISP